MSAAAWPLPAGVVSQRVPSGSVVALAALAVPDVVDPVVFWAHMATHLPAMGAAVHARSGQLAGEVGAPARPLPLQVLHRPEGLAALATLAGRGEHDDHRHLSCPGFDLRTAHEVLVGWADVDACGLVIVAASSSTARYAGALS